MYAPKPQTEIVIGKIKKPVFRSVVKVIEEMIRIIPKTEVHLLQDINNYYENELWNKAPEVLAGPECWIPLKNILTKHTLVFDQEWKQSLLKLFNGIE
jgi:hypothetical protein